MPLEQFSGIVTETEPSKPGIPTPRQLGNIVPGAYAPVLAKHPKRFSLQDRLGIGVHRMQLSQKLFAGTEGRITPAQTIGSHTRIRAWVLCYLSLSSIFTEARSR
jgi:hypothetical protein